MKCKFIKKCPYYTEGDFTCEKDGGMYYADGTEPAGCWVRMEERRLRDKMGERK